MELSNNLKKRFVKDYKLPITVLKEPYFSYFIDLYDRYYQTISLLERYIDYCNQFDTEDELFDNFSNVTETIIEAVKNTNAYELFTRFDMSKYKTENSVSKTSFYNGDTETMRNYFSIDLKKANFQALKFFDPELVLGCESYEELIETAYGGTIHPHLKESKQVRQVIFGNLSPKRQQTIQKYIMDEMINVLRNIGVSDDDIMISSPDEVIVKDHDEQINVQAIMDQYPYDVEFHMDHFMLVRIHSDHNYFVKIYEDHDSVPDECGFLENVYEFKNVPAPFMAEVMKYLFNKEVNEYDRTFYADGRIAQYQDSLFES